MRVLIVGGGGREHALAKHLFDQEKDLTLFIAPGNPGTAQCGSNLPVKASDLEGMLKEAKDQSIDFVIIGPDDPIAMGMQDMMKGAGILCLGPGKAGAQLEASKAWAKGFMGRHGIPTAQYQTYSKSQIEALKAYIETCALPLVLKLDTLAAGKGVEVCDTKEKCLDFVKRNWENNDLAFPDSMVVAETFLEGMEMSYFALTDGERYVVLPEAKDYKRIGEGDIGPNTGGMGAVSPVGFATEALLKKIEATILIPTIKGLQVEGISYRGFIFIGLMVNGEDVSVIEYNARLGDPETQVILPRLKEPLLPLLFQAAQGKLESSRTLEVNEKVAITVVAASAGYPGKPVTGNVIQGLNGLPEGILVFHAGTQDNGTDIITSGGRVLALTALSDSLKDAQEQVMAAQERINFEGKYYRTDIGNDLLAL